MRGDSLPRMAAIMLALALGGLASAAEAADPAAGKAVFSSTCSICHSVQPSKNMVGPSSVRLGGPEDRLGTKLPLFTGQSEREPHLG